VKEQERLIIRNCTKLPMQDVLDLAFLVVIRGRESGNGTCYCHLTTFKNGVICFATRNKRSDTLTFYEGVTAREGGPYD
jgi:hypothetical protein